MQDSEFLNAQLKIALDKASTTTRFHDAIMNLVMVTDTDRLPALAVRVQSKLPQLLDLAFQYTRWPATSQSHKRLKRAASNLICLVHDTLLPRASTTSALLTRLRPYYESILELRGSLPPSSARTKVAKVATLLKPLHDQARTAPLKTMR